MKKIFSFLIMIVALVYSVTPAFALTIYGQQPVYNGWTGESTGFSVYVGDTTQVTGDLYIKVKQGNFSAQCNTQIDNIKFQDHVAARKVIDKNGTVLFNYAVHGFGNGDPIPADYSGDITYYFPSSVLEGWKSANSSLYVSCDQGGQPTFTMGTDTESAEYFVSSDEFIPYVEPTPTPTPTPSGGASMGDLTIPSSTALGGLVSDLLGLNWEYIMIFMSFPIAFYFIAMVLELYKINEKKLK